MLVGSFEKINRVSVEEASLEEWVHVELDLLQGEVREDSHEDLGDVLILELQPLDPLTGRLVHFIDQVETCHSVNLKGEKFVLLCLRWSVALGQHSMDSHGIIDSACSKGPLDMIRVKELLNCSGSAGCAE